MGWDDREDGIAFIQGIGLPCENAPQDYYLLAVDLLPCCVTPNDGEVEFVVSWWPPSRHTPVTIISYSMILS